MMFENTAFLALCCLINFHELDFRTFGQIIHSVSAIVCFVTLWVMIGALIFLYAFWQYLSPNSKLMVYFNLFISEYKSKRAVILMAINFIVRRILLAVNIEYFRVDAQF